MEAIVLISIAVIWLGVSLGSGGAGRAGYGRSYDLDFDPRDKLPRTPPAPYKDEGGLYR